MRRNAPWLLVVALILVGAAYPRRTLSMLVFYQPNAATYIDKSANIRMQRGTTVERIDCYTSSSTQGVNVVRKTDPSQAGSDVCTADMTASTTGVACASLALTTVAAGSYLSLDVEGGTSAIAVSCTVAVSY